MSVVLALIFACPIFIGLGFMWGRSRYEPPKDEHLEALMRELRPASDEPSEPVK